MSTWFNKDSHGEITGPSAKLILIPLGVLAAALTWSYAVEPRYRVWEREMAGKAELAQAEYNRRIAVLEAQAKKDAATSLAEAEVERAKGVAAANKIIGESLQGHDEYLRYLWIQTLHDSDTSVIYVPTEANLPVLEASRMVSSK